MKRCLNCMNVYDDDLIECPHCNFREGTQAETEYHLAPGVIVGERYIIGVALGHGGFGITYKAWDEKLETVIAIKEFFPAHLVSRIPGRQEVNLQGERRRDLYHKEMQKFLQEARTLAKFNSHPNIVHVSDYFEANNTAYMVMEYLDGIDLLKYVKEKRNQRMSPEETLPIISDVCKAMEAIHREGIVHRDVSPDNIRITSAGKVKLLDFGAAKESQISNASEFTVVIKPGYAPPEQYMKKSKIGPWTDVYALCATMYRLLTGKKPAEASDRRAEECLIAPRELNPELPLWLEQVILRGMALEPENRFRDIEQLEKALNQKEGVALPEQVAKRKSYRKIAAFVTAVVACAVTIVLLVHWGSGRELTDEDVPDGELIVSLPDTAYNRKAYTDAADRFEEKFPGKSVKLDFSNFADAEADVFMVSAKQMRDKVYQDYDNNEVYADTIEFHNEIHPKDYYFMDVNADIDRYVPLSADVYVLVYNKYLIARDEDMEELIEYEDSIDIYDLETVADRKSSLRSVVTCEEIGIAAYDRAVSQFCKEKCTAVIARTRDISRIQQKLAGYYEVLPLTFGGSYRGDFGNQFSINFYSEKESLAVLWLEFLLSNEGQSILLVENNSGLPLNKDTFAKYIQIHSNLNALAENADQVQFMN